MSNRFKRFVSIICVLSMLMTSMAGSFASELEGNQATPPANDPPAVTEPAAEPVPEPVQEPPATEPEATSEGENMPPEEQEAPEGSGESDESADEGQTGSDEGTSDESGKDPSREAGEDPAGESNEKQQSEPVQDDSPKQQDESAKDQPDGHQDGEAKTADQNLNGETKPSEQNPDEKSQENEGQNNTPEEQGTVPTDSNATGTTPGSEQGAAPVNQDNHQPEQPQNGSQEDQTTQNQNETQEPETPATAIQAEENEDEGLNELTVNGGRKSATADPENPVRMFLKAEKTETILLTVTLASDDEIDLTINSASQSPVDTAQNEEETEKALTFRKDVEAENAYLLEISAEKQTDFSIEAVSASEENPDEPKAEDDGENEEQTEVQNDDENGKNPEISTDVTDETKKKEENSDDKSNAEEKTSEEGEIIYSEGGTFTASGADYTITVTYGADARFPEGTALAVEEILPSDPRYAEMTGLSADKLIDDDWKEMGDYQRVFDITFLYEGHEIEPEAAIQVDFQFSKAISLEENSSLEVVHVDNEKNAEVVSTETSAASTGENGTTDVDTLSFTSDSFSTYIISQTKEVTEETISDDEQVVSITYGKDSEIPRNAQVSVTKIEEGTEAYETYRRQLINQLGIDETRQTVRFSALYDITIQNEQKSDISMNADATVTVTAALPEEAAQQDNLLVVHFDEAKEEAVELNATSNSDNTVTFETNGFSVYGFAYTVDYTFENHEYHMQGETSMLLSELFEKLNINADAGHAVKVTFTDETLLAVEETENDWTLTSLKPFTSQEVLTVTMNDDTVYVIAVTDAQENRPLNDTLIAASIFVDGVPFVDGSVVTSGKSYAVELEFQENDHHQFVDDDTEMYYDLPSGIDVPNMSGTFDMEFGDLGKLSGNHYRIENGKVYIQWNTSDSMMDLLRAADDAHFKIRFDARFYSSTKKIDWSTDISTNIDVQEPHNATISKCGEYDETNGVINYTVTVASEGTTSDIKITDGITGNALVSNVNTASDITIVVKHSDGTTSQVEPTQFIKTEKGFAINLPDMIDGDIYTVRYSATVDYSKLEKSGTTTYFDTNNGVKLEYKETDKPKEDTNYSYTINYSTIGKEATNVSDVVTGGDGQRYRVITWKVISNPERKVPVTFITDSIREDSRSLMTMQGEGISVKVTKEDGKVEDRELTWGNNGLTLSDDYSWTYKPPETDGNASYEITYQTKAIIDGLDQAKVVNNDVEYDHGQTGNGTSVGPDGETTVVKTATAVSQDEVNWSIDVSIPKSGTSNTRVTDVLPNSQGYYDSFKSCNVAGLDSSNEKYEISYLYRHYRDQWNYDEYEEVLPKNEGDFPVEVYINFMRLTGDGTWENGLNSNGNDRNIHIEITTINNRDWLAQAETDYWTYADHKNIVQFGTLSAESKVQPALKKITKEASDNTTVTLKDGKTYPAYKFNIVLQGITDGRLQVFDSFDTDVFEVLDNNELDESTYQYSNPFTPSNGGNGAVYGGSNVTTFDHLDTHVATLTPTSNGILISTEDLDKTATGAMYNCYKISYYLVMKHPEIAAQRAMELDGEAKYTNSVNWDGAISSVDITYGHPILDKNVSINDNKATYTIVINPDKLKLGAHDSEGNYPDTLTLTDTFSSSLSIDYNSIAVSTEPSTNGVSYDYAGNTGTFIIPNETKVTITYTCTIIGTGLLRLHNKAVLDGTYIDETDDYKEMSSSGEGGASIIAVNLLKYKSGHMEEGPLAGAKFRILDSEKNPIRYSAKAANPTSAAKAGQEITFTTEAGNLLRIMLSRYDHGVTLKKNTVYYLEEIEAPDGYQLDSTQYSFVITDDKSKANYYRPDGVWVYYVGDIIKIRNTPEKQQLTIYKRFEGNVSLTDEQKAKIRFLIQQVDEQNRVIQGGYSKTINYSDLSYDKYTISSSEDNSFVPGYYRVTEIVEDLGLSSNIVSETTYNIAANGERSDGTGTQTSPVQVEADKASNVIFTNSYSTGAYYFNKVEAGTEQPLAGAEFTVFNADTQTTVTTYMTGDDGKFMIAREGANLSIFTENTLYYVMETKAPDGFVIPDPAPKYYFYFASAEGEIPDGATEYKAINLSAENATETVVNASETSIMVKKDWVKSDGRSLTEEEIKNLFAEVKLKRTVAKLKKVEVTINVKDGSGTSSKTLVIKPGSDIRLSWKNYYGNINYNEQEVNDKEINISGIVDNTVVDVTSNGWGAFNEMVITAEPATEYGEPTVDSSFNSDPVTLNYNNDFYYSWDELEAESADGDQYLYFAEETNASSGFRCLSYTNNEGITNGVITITNEEETEAVGSLKIQKIMTINREDPTDANKQFANGSFSFNVYAADEHGQKTGDVLETITVNVVEGISESVESRNTYEEGTYIVEEVISGLPEYVKPVEGSSRPVTVTAGKTGESVETTGIATFTNDKTVTEPTFEKKIKDINDSTDADFSNWQDSADHDIGDEIPFLLKATLANNVSDYYKYHIMFHDEMEAGLTFDRISSVKIGGKTIDSKDYTLTKNGDHRFTLTLTWGDGTTTAKLPTDLDGAEVLVEYYATLNENANFGKKGNINAAYLEYSNNPSVSGEDVPSEETDKTKIDAVIVFTYQAEISKTDQDGTPLAGAEFTLTKAVKNGEPKVVSVVKGTEGTTFSFKGLDDGEYTLAETTVPTGYKGISPIKVTVTAGHVTAWEVAADHTVAVDNTGKISFDTLVSTDTELVSREALLTSLAGNAQNADDPDSGRLSLTADTDIATLSGTILNAQTTFTPEAQKIVSGSIPAGSVFTFKLTDISSNERKATESYTDSEMQKDLTGAGKVTFGTITYWEAGTYTYQIEEVVPETIPDGMSYNVNNSHIELTVTVEESADGKLAATGVYSGGDGTDHNGITNRFEKPTGKAKIEVSKALKGNSSLYTENEDFTFKLSHVTANGSAQNGSNAPNPKDGKTSIIVKAGATAAYDWIEFESAGEYYYLIEETAGATPGMTYDSAKHYALIKVTYNRATNQYDTRVTYGDSPAACQAEGAATSLTVTNTYRKATYTPEVKKVLEPDNAVTETFSFQLVDTSSDQSGETPGKTTASCVGSGTATFGEIVYTKAGTYTYEISEIMPKNKTAGMVYSTGKVTITVEVKENAETGALSVEAPVITGGDTENHELKNTYTKPTGSATLVVEKQVTGDTTYNPDEEFEFSLTAVSGSDSENNPIVTIPMPASEAGKKVKVKAGQTVNFGSINYETAGVYLYKIEENEPEEESKTLGMTYNTAPKYAQVTVALVGENLVADVKYGDTENGSFSEANKVTITNTYSQHKGGLRIVKHVTANSAAISADAEEYLKNVADGIYHFALLQDGQIVPGYGDITIQVVNGQSAYKDINDLMPGDYVVRELTEKNQANRALISGNDIQVTVTADMKAEADGAPKAEFTNNAEYGSLKIKKNVKVNGEDTAASDMDGDYTFTVQNETTKESRSVILTISGGQSNTVEVKYLAPGKYTVNENNSSLLASQNGLVIDVTAGNTGEIRTAEFTNNKVAVGKLNITKNVTVNGAVTTTTLADGTYEFEIRNTVTRNTTKATVVIENGVSRTTTVENLPAGIYQVNETGRVPADSSITLSGVKLNGADAANGLEVEIKADNDTSIPTVAFTNDKKVTGSLKIQKTTTGGVNTPANTEFIVRGPEGFTETIIKYSAFKNGVYDNFKSVPLGTYTVTEKTETGKVTGYTLTVKENGKTATLDLENRDATIVIENQYEEMLGSLEIVKETNGATTPANTEFTVTGPGNYTRTVRYSEFTNGTFTISDLKLGTYTVTERTDTAELAAYSLSVEGNGRSATLMDTARNGTVSIENTYNDKGEGEITIVKTTSPATVETPENTIFTVTGPAGFASISVRYSEFTNGEYKIQHLPFGTYTVTENVGTAAQVGYDLKVTGNGGTAIVSADHLTDGKVEIQNEYTKNSGDLKISKEVTGNSVTSNDLSRQFTFTVYLKDSNDQPVIGSFKAKKINAANSVTETTVIFTAENGLGKSDDIKLAHQESIQILGIPTGASYTVSEASASGFVAAKAGDTGVIIKDELVSAVFTNTKDTYGSFKVQKVVEGNAVQDGEAFKIQITLSEPLSGTYGDVTFNEGKSDELTILAGQILNVTGVPNKVVYTVTETDAKGYITTITGNTKAVDSSLTGDNIPTVVVKNTRNLYGGFTLTKQTEGTAVEQGKSYHFTVELGLDAERKAINGKRGDLTFTNGVATVDLKSGEAVYIKGLDHGTEYTVTEDDYSNDGYVTTPSRIISGKVIGTSENPDSIQNYPNENRVVVRNIRNKAGSLNITKITNGTDGNVNREFHFTAKFELPSTITEATERTKKYGEVQFEDGEATVTFALKSGMNKVIGDLPNGTTFSVTEAEADQDGYKTTYKLNGTTVEKLEGVINYQTTMVAEVTNTLDLFGGIRITKKTEGNDKDKKTWFAYKVTLKKDGMTFNGNYGDVTFIDGVSTAPAGTTDADYTRIKNGERVVPDGFFKIYTGEANAVVIKGLPSGTEYTIEEASYAETYDKVETEKNGIRTSGSMISGIVKGTSADAFLSTVHEENQETYINTRDRYGKLEIVKKLFGNGADASKVFTIKIETEPKLNGTYDEVRFENGIGYVYLSGGQSKLITGLPLDTRFKVTEVLDPADAKYEVSYELSYGEQLYDQDGNNVKDENGKNVKPTRTEATNEGVIKVDQRTVTITNTLEKPAIEKYVNKVVHSDLPAFDTTFVYDIISYIPIDADTAEIYDVLDDNIQDRANKNALVFISQAEEVGVVDLGETVDHTVNGSVKSSGTAIAESAKVQTTINGKKLTVRIADATSLRGHWVKVTYTAQIDQEAIKSLNDYEKATLTIDQNTPVLGGETRHTGIANTASYKVWVKHQGGSGSGTGEGGSGTGEGGSGTGEGGSGTEGGGGSEGDTSEDGGVKPDTTPKYEEKSNTVTVTPPTTKISFTKQWTDENDAARVWPEGVTVSVKLTKALNGGDHSEVSGFDAVVLDEQKTSGSFNDIPVYENVTYSITETVSGLDPQLYTMTLSDPDNSVAREQGFTITNQILETSASVMKVWADEENLDGIRPLSLTVTLMADGVATDRKVTLNEQNHWTATIEHLPLKNMERTAEIKYSWQEAETAGYKLTDTREIQNKDGKMTILLNTHVPGTKEISVRKVWDDNDNARNTRPASVKVQLFANGIARGETLTLNAENGWRGSWTGLPGTEDGKAIRYTVEEIGVPEGYSVSVSGNADSGFTVTNSLERGRIVITKTFEVEIPEEEPEAEDEYREVTVRKVWVDNDDRDGNRPGSVTVHLYAGGTEVASAQITAAEGWEHTFYGLPATVDGRRIHYSVTEDPVAWYVGSVNGFTVTNTYQPETTRAAVTKIWNDNLNEQGIRPAQVRVTLSNGQGVVTQAILSEENGWTATVGNLPTRVNGAEAVYSWSEEPVIGYVLEDIRVSGQMTEIVNKPWDRENIPENQKPKRVPGNTFYIFEDYDTPLGVEVMINHVGDCFD